MPSLSRRVDVIGCQVDALTFEQSLERACELIESPERGHQHVVVNAAKAVAAASNPELRETINNCDMVNADGQAIVWASRLLGNGLPERVAGIDFMLEMWAVAAQRGYSVYLLGATEEVVSAAVTRCRSKGVNVVGYRNGYWEALNERDMVSEIAAHRPDLLFLAIPSPRKELFLSRHLRDMNVGLAVGVGGSFDVVAGKTKRAPLVLQNLGLEWVFRLAQEPRRLFMRYLIGNTKFTVLVLSAMFRKVFPRGR